jgi:DNA-binding transcriptional LysR family regulator
MDRLDAMAILVTAVETGSLSAAGRKLRVPLPTVSRKISDLEAHLNSQLLIRSTRKLATTAAGAAYVAAAKRILDQVDEAERVATGEFAAPRGEIVVTAPILFGRLHVLPVVADFLNRFREIDARLMLSDRNMHLIDDHIDLAVRIGALTDHGLKATRLGTVRHVVCGSPDYFDRNGTPEEPGDLSRLSAITFEGLGGAAFWSFPMLKSGREKSVPVRSRLQVNTAEAAIDAAIAGVGVTRVLSYQVVQAVAAGRLRIVLADFEPEPLPVHLVYAGQEFLPLKTRALVDHMGPRIRERLAGTV